MPVGEADAIATALQDLNLRQVALTAQGAGAEDWKTLGVDFVALVARFPESASIRDAHGGFLWERNDHQGAMREWQAGERIEPKNAAVLNHLAAACVAMGEPRAGLGYYLRATDVVPEDALTHFSAANVACLFRHDLGRTEEECFRLALKHFAEAHRLAPKNPEFARGYAETFYIVPNPDWETARMVWTKYLNIVPEKDFALLNLARVHLKRGDAENARACLSRVTGKGSEILKNRLAARIEAEISPGKTPKTPGTEKTLKPAIDENPERP